MTQTMPTEADPVVVWEGDALEVLASLPVGTVHHVITDPPFGVNLTTHTPAVCMDGTKRLRTRGWAIAGDDDTWTAQAVFRWADDHSLPLVAFGSPYRPYPGEWRNVLVWDKGPAVGGGGDPATCWKRTFELIFARRNRPLSEGRDEAVLRFPINTGSDFEYHPCQKPLRLLRYLIRQLTEPGDVILDPFAGSGSLGVAAMQEGRRAILIEGDPTHAATARRRVAEAMGTGLLAFTGEDRP